MSVGASVYTGGVSASAVSCKDITVTAYRTSKNDTVVPSQDMDESKTPTGRAWSGVRASHAAISAARPAASNAVRLESRDRAMHCTPVTPCSRQGRWSEHLRAWGRGGCDCLLEQPVEEHAARTLTPPVEPEGEFLQVLASDSAMVGAQQPALQQGSDAMHPWEVLFGLVRIPSRHGSFVPIAAGVQLGIAGPAVRTYHASGLDPLENERFQAGRRSVGHASPANAPAPWSVFLRRYRNQGFLTEIALLAPRRPRRLRPPRRIRSAGRVLDAPWHVAACAAMSGPSRSGSGRASSAARACSRRSSARSPTTSLGTTLSEACPCSGGRR